MAFHFCKKVLIFFTVCWKDLINILDTFYSSNASKNNQSAGNLNWGSSETKRESNYDLFKTNYYYFFKENFSKDNDWLSWFIGFVEGDGSIYISNNRCYFVITQKDPLVLHEIKNTLKFGKINYFYDNKGEYKYARFIIADNKSIFLLFLLFNGNLVLPTKLERLKKWNGVLNKARKFNFSYFQVPGNKVPELILKLNLPSLSDGWISGFTDAEGCFSIRINNIKNKYYVQYLYILDQKYEKDILNYIGNLFYTRSSAKIRTGSFLKNNVMFRLTIFCKDSKNNNRFEIINYFNKFQLKTSKSQSFDIWCNIIKLTFGIRITPDLLIIIKELKKNMNKFEIKINSKFKSDKS